MNESMHTPAEVVLSVEHAYMSLVFSEIVLCYRFDIFIVYCDVIVSIGRCVHMKKAECVLMEKYEKL